jgi:lipopolysaccharide biosynthesis glycosyltransferase
MINLLLCGNKKVFDGALSQLISIINRTSEILNCYIFTMDATRLKPEYVPIEDMQIDFLNKVVKEKNNLNNVTKVDVTKLYEKEFMGCKNETAYCTPYTLLRLLADLVPGIPDKLLYLDIDIMVGRRFK